MFEKDPVVGCYRNTLENHRNVKVIKGSRSEDLYPKLQAVIEEHLLSIKNKDYLKQKKKMKSDKRKGGKVILGPSNLFKNY